MQCVISTPHCDVLGVWRVSASHRSGGVVRWPCSLSFSWAPCCTRTGTALESSCARSRLSKVSHASSRERGLCLTSPLHAGLLAVELCFELWVWAATTGPPVWSLFGCALVCFAVGRSRRSAFPPGEQEVYVQGVGGRSERSIHHVLRRRGRRLDRHGRRQDRVVRPEVAVARSGKRSGRRARHLSRRRCPRRAPRQARRGYRGEQARPTPSVRRNTSNADCVHRLLESHRALQVLRVAASCLRGHSDGYAAATPLECGETKQ